MTWDPIDENLTGGPVKGYVIHLSRLISRMSHNETRDVIVLRENGTRRVLNGLSADAWYKVEVSAIVTAGKTGIELKGPFSRAVRIKTPAAAGMMKLVMFRKIRSIPILCLFLFYRCSPA